MPQKGRRCPLTSARIAAASAPKAYRLTGVVFTTGFGATGTTPARSPITLINSEFAGTTILAFCERARSMASSLRSTWALPTKYLSAASLTSWMACASPSAARIWPA